jgi:hypothetical protein
MPTTRAASQKALSAPRVAVRPSRRGARRKAPPFRPHAPADFFSPEAWRLLSSLLQQRAHDWQVAGQPRSFYYRQHSEPVWDEAAHYRCSGATLHVAGLGVLCLGMGIDLERALRLLTLDWRADGKTLDGRERDDWRAALISAFWRIGQHYRELQRRKGAGALDMLREEVERLPTGAVLRGCIC